MMWYTLMFNSVIPVDIIPHQKVCFKKRKSEHDSEFHIQNNLFWLKSHVLSVNFQWLDKCWFSLITFPSIFRERTEWESVIQIEVPFIPDSDKINWKIMIPDKKNKIIQFILKWDDSEWFSSIDFSCQDIKGQVDLRWKNMICFGFQKNETSEISWSLIMKWYHPQRSLDSDGLCSFFWKFMISWDKTFEQGVLRSWDKGSSGHKLLPCFNIILNTVKPSSGANKISRTGPSEYMFDVRW